MALTPTQRQMKIDPRLIQAMQMQQTGSSTEPVQSPLEGLARALQAPIGAWAYQRAEDDIEDEQAQKRRQQAESLADLLVGPKQQPPGIGPTRERASQMQGMNAERDRIVKALSAETIPMDAAGRIAFERMLPEAQEPLKEERLAQAMGLTPGTPEYNEFLRQLVVSNPDEPASIREWNAFQQMSPDQQRQYLTMKRSSPYLNLGDVFAQPDPTQPGQTMGQFSVGLPPERDIQDDRVVVSPAVPGGPVRGGQQHQMPPGMASGGAGVGAPVPPPAQPAQAPQGPSVGPPPSSQMPQPGQPGITELPPSPGERREIAKEEEQAAARQAQKDVYADVVTQDIDRAMGLIEDNETFTTGMGGALLSNVPETDARDVRALIDTIKANVGFDRLQQMREQSPTGGALGQVSEFENRLLQATIGNLEQSQSAEQLKTNLRRVKDLYRRIINQGVSPDDPIAKEITGGTGRAARFETMPPDELYQVEIDDLNTREEIKAYMKAIDKATGNAR